MKKRIAILQSNYIPWKGYFDIIKHVDEFVIYDEVQYTRNDWRNRNLIKTPEGLFWLTIPIKRDFGQKINEAEVADNGWPMKHWKTLRHVYNKAPQYEVFAISVKQLYETVPSQKLTEINYHFLSGINKLLKIDTIISFSTDFEKEDGKTMRLISICRQADADIYVSGPAARDYLDEEEFERHNIEVEWVSYENYKTYPQIHGSFEHKVSILDLMFHTGHKVADYMKF